MLPIFKHLEEIFIGYKANDEVDHEVNGETDYETDEQPDTTDMSEFKSEKSAAQRREHEGKGLKILTPEQMFYRLPISLAQLEA